MEVIKYPKREIWSQILQRPAIEMANLEGIVKEIFDKVKQNGDEALRYYNARFDQCSDNELVICEDAIVLGSKAVDAQLQQAIKAAGQNISKFHETQRKSFEKVETMPGVECWMKQVPIQKVGLYIPGGTAPLLSTVLMLAIPAKIAGCKQIILCTPPEKDGSVNPAILYAAKVSGVSEIYKVGGAQAIAAMAFGTETIPKVDKIFGPGNQYVTYAKQLVSMMGLSIDMPAGPSEVAVLADKTANPVFVASDLLSQAEHGIDSQAVLITDSDELIEEVQREIQIQLNELPRKEIAQQALNQSKVILTRNIDEAIDLSNEYAPEHLIISVEDYSAITNRIENAGSVFLGNYTPESAGDYASGTNHTLPTNGYAKSVSGLGLDSFMKTITFQEISKEGLLTVGPIIEKMAKAEYLDGHKQAVTKRLLSIRNELEVVNSKKE